MNNCIVRLSTSYWSDHNGLYVKRAIRYQRRLTQEPSTYQVLSEDLSNLEASEVIGSIINLDDCPDGLYEVVLCDLHRNRHTGTVEEYNYKLIKYETH